MKHDEQPPMDDHTWIDDEQVAERYVLGKLSEADAERFEEHYLHCSACLDRVEAAEGLQQGLARVVAQDVARVRTGLAAVLVRWSRSRAMPWVASLALLVVMLLPSGYLMVERGELADQLERSRSETARVDARVESQTTRIGELEAQADHWRREAESREAEARQRRRPRPSGHTVIVTLGPERSAASEPSVRLTLPETSEWLVLALEVEPPEAPSYRVALENPAGKVVWEGSGLLPDALGSVNLSVPSEILGPGVWTARLTPESHEGRQMPETRFAFRVRSPEGGRP